MPNPIATAVVPDADSGELDGLVLLHTEAQGVAVVTINQAGTGNAINGAVAKALKEAFETLHAAEAVRIVFLKGAGGTFCSGADPSWLKVVSEDWSEADLREEALSVAAMYQALTAIPALTVALIEKEAIGGGAGLAAACDLAVATASTRFCFPEVSGGAVAAIVAPFVVNAIGPRQAKALLATGRTFDAAHAEKIGLIHEMVDDTAGLNAAADRLTRQAMLNAPGAVAETKRMVWHVWTRAQDHGLMEDCAKRFAKSRFSDEGREGLNAARQGRSPSWAGE